MDPLKWNNQENIISELLVAFVLVFMFFFHNLNKLIIQIKMKKKWADEIFQGP
jgi:hypothetical protein